MQKEFPPLYTPESIVFRDRVDRAKLEYPITVLVDSAGNHALVHGNHRSYRAFELGINNEREIIGKINKDVSKDPYYRPISALEVRG